MTAVAAFLFGHVADLRPIGSIAAPADVVGWFSAWNPELPEFSVIPDSPPPRA
jgi:hypothetical protein